MNNLFNKEENFWNLFENEEYPKNVADRGVPQGVCYEYISATFLNGYINYVTPFYVVMIERYEKMTDETNEEILEILKQQFHTDYGCHELMDDILMLAESDESYWFFWFDHDVSDCCIGRISKENISKEEYKKLFLEVFNENSNFDYKKYLELPMPTGWIKF